MWTINGFPTYADFSEWSTNVKRHVLAIWSMGNGSLKIVGGEEKR
jgi:hypothetical protein